MRPRDRRHSIIANWRRKTSSARWAQIHGPILVGFRSIFVHTCHPRLRHIEQPVDQIDVSDSQRQLLGGSQSGEDAELVEVTLRFSPIAMEGRDPKLGDPQS